MIYYHLVMLKFNYESVSVNLTRYYTLLDCNFLSIYE